MEEARRHAKEEEARHAHRHDDDDDDDDYGGMPGDNFVQKPFHQKHRNMATNLLFIPFINQLSCQRNARRNARRNGGWHAWWRRRCGKATNVDAAVNVRSRPGERVKQPEDHASFVCSHERRRLVMSCHVACNR